MRFNFKILFVVFCGLVVTLPVSARLYTNSNRECFCEDSGNDTFWFCGLQSLSCKGTSVWKKNKVYWHYHGDDFTGNGIKYYCCNGTTSGAGQYVQGNNWITKTETVTEVLPNGKCTWTRKTNICGQVDNPGDKCTEATGECTTGFVSHNGKCVAACPEGQAFASNTSSACVACEPSVTQGIKKNVCIKCESNQFFDNNTLSCVSRSSKLQVTSNAFNDCWMCATPGSMYNCMKLLSNGGSLNTNPKLQIACSVNGNTEDATEFKLPEKSIKLKVLPIDFKLKAVKVQLAQPVAAIN